MIEAIGIEKRIEERVLFHCEHLKFENKGFYIIKGPNGCGKTTFLKMLFGKDRDFKGYIKSNFNKKVMLSQQPYFFKGSVSYNLYIALKQKSQKEAEKILNRFSIAPDVDINNLSLGQKQLVAFLRAFLIDSDVIFLDEPDSYLDSNVREFIYDMIYKDSEKRCIIMVTHNQLLKLEGKFLYFDNNQILEKR